MVEAVTDANFVEETKDGVVLIDFWATWCRPCQMQAPILDAAEKEYDGQVKFVKMDVDENTETATEFGIMSIPTLMIKKDNEVVEKLVGVQQRAQLDATLKKYI